MSDRVTWDGASAVGVRMAGNRERIGEDEVDEFALVISGNDTHVLEGSRDELWQFAMDVIGELQKPPVLHVEITSDGVNPGSKYKVPGGVVLTIERTGPDLEDIESVVIEGPHDGDAPDGAVL